MQLSNGAIKHTAQPAMMPATLVDEPEGVDLETFDLSAFVVPVPKKDNPEKQAAKDATSKAVEAFLSESSNLFEQGERYQVEVVERGHRALYELLASIYDLSIRIDENEHKDKILEAIRKELKDNHSITLKASSTPIAVLVKYVVRVDKATASRYTKVLNVALQEKLTPAELPEYITRRGGVSQIQDVESVALAKKAGDKTSKDRTALIREFFTLVGMSSKNELTFAGDVVPHVEEKEDDDKKEAENSTFCVFVAHHVTGDKYKIVSANDLGKSYEDSLIKYLGKAMPSNLSVLEHGIRNYKKRLANDPSQPESLRKEMQRQLAVPLKYKTTEVIEVDATQLNSDDEA
jgi:hypothetical protein